jgi:hypothetical protein
MTAIGTKIISRSPTFLTVVAFFVSTSGCVSTTGGYSSSNTPYAVGPARMQEKIVVADSNREKHEAVDLSVLVLPLDPNLPNNTDEYAEEGIWPELRRAEGNRFAVKIRDALSENGTFRSARVVPGKDATGNLYVGGKILQSNGENIKLSITVTAITGEVLIKNKVYSHRVKEYELENPRNRSDYDLYQPIFDEIAWDISKKVQKLPERQVTDMNIVEELRFGESFSPEYFSSYMETSEKGITRLTSAPADEDMMLKRTRELRIRDKLFIDDLQKDYNNFSIQMWDAYQLWQRQSYVESKAARKAKTKEIGKKILGVVALAGGIALAATAGDTNSSGAAAQALGGTVLAAAGFGVVASSVGDSADAAMHKESMNELGRSLNIDLAPKVIQMEERTVELKGDASEQYSIWRNFLLDLYELDTTPNISL